MPRNNSKKLHDFGPDVIQLECQSDKAFGVQNGDKDPRTKMLKIIWLPKSEVEYDKETKTFTMPEWLAYEKGLI